MKIFIINTHYQNFTDDFYAQHPELKNADYETQWNKIMDEKFANADFYSKNLEKVGWEAKEFIPNNKILQEQWAKEHNVKIYFNPPDFLKKIPRIGFYFKNYRAYKILEAQIKNYKPDIILIQDIFFCHPLFLKSIKAKVKMLIGQFAFSVPPYRYLRYYNLIITSFPSYVPMLRKMGFRAEYLKLGFEPLVLDRVKKFNRQYETVFVGGISRRSVKNIPLLENLAQSVEIDFWGYIHKDVLDENSPILSKHHGPVWGIDMYNILYNSKIAINRHDVYGNVNVGANFANNMRLYEATGAGTMLITDMKDNLGELFEIGKEVETYRSSEELIEKIKYYLAHEDERKRIALAGQQRTLKEHTYESRMKELVGIIKKYLP